jgi:hypothetical protein
MVCFFLNTVVLFTSGPRDDFILSTAHVDVV